MPAANGVSSQNFTWTKGLAEGGIARGTGKLKKNLRMEKKLDPQPRSSLQTIENRGVTESRLYKCCKPKGLLRDEVWHDFGWSWEDGVGDTRRGRDRKFVL